MLEIRQATAKDAQAVLDFCKLVGGESDNLTYDGSGLPFTPEEEAAYLASMEASDHNFFLIAWEQDQIVGTCSYSGYANERLAHRGELGIAVRKSMWGRQVGSKLMEAIIELAKTPPMRKSSPWRCAATTSGPSPYIKSMALRKSGNSKAF